MSAPAIRSVLDRLQHLDLSTAERLTLIVIADHANPTTGNAWPSRERLMRCTGLSRATLPRVLASLVRLGLLESLPRTGFTTMYRLPDLETEQGGLQVSRGEATGEPTGGYAVAIEQEQENKTNGNGKSKEAEVTSTSAPPALSGISKEPTEEDQMKLPGGISVSEIAALAQKEFDNITDEMIVDVPRVNGRFTANGLAECWRKAHGVYREGFHAGCSVKQKGQLSAAYKTVGDSMPALILGVLRDWSGFIGYAAHTAGAFHMPTHPTVAFFVQYIGAASNFLIAKENSAKALAASQAAWKAKHKDKITTITAASPAVQLIAQAEPAKMSAEEILAAMEEVELEHAADLAAQAAKTNAAG